MLSSDLAAGPRGFFSSFFFFYFFDDHCLFHFSQKILELRRTDRSYALWQETPIGERMRTILIEDIEEYFIMQWINLAKYKNLKIKKVMTSYSLKKFYLD